MIAKPKRRSMRPSAFTTLILLTSLAHAPACAGSAVETLPIIDMHVHAMVTLRPVEVSACPGDQPILNLPIDPVTAPADAPTVSCPHPIYSVTRKAEFRRQSIAALRKTGVVRAVLIGSPQELAVWQTAAPGLFVPASMPLKRTPAGLDELRAAEASGAVKLFGDSRRNISGVVPTVRNSRHFGRWRKRATSRLAFTLVRASRSWASKAARSTIGPR